MNALPRVPAYPLDTLPRLSVSESAVRSALLQLNQTKASGPDNFSAKIILECADQLVSPLTKIFAKSVETGVFPNLWKEANIIPVLKKDDRRNPANYRSISLISLFGKVLEKIVHDQLYRHVSSALCPEQHGFIPNKSCVSNLAVYLCSVWEAMQEGYQTDTIYTDFFFGFSECKSRSTGSQVGKFLSSQRLCTTMVRLVSLRQASESRGERKDLSMDRSHFRCARRLTFGSFGICSLHQ